MEVVGLGVGGGELGVGRRVFFLVGISVLPGAQYTNSRERPGRGSDRGRGALGGGGEWSTEGSGGGGGCGGRGDSGSPQMSRDEAGRERGIWRGEEATGGSVAVVLEIVAEGEAGG